MRAARPARDGLVGGRAARRVHDDGARGPGRRAGAARRAGLVHRPQRRHGRLLGRLQRRAARDAPPAAARGDRADPLVARPLHDRRALRRRHAALRRLGGVAVRDAGRDAAAAAAAHGRRRGLRGAVAPAAGGDAAVALRVAAPPAARRLLAPRLPVRGLGLDRGAGAVHRRLAGRLPRRLPGAARQRPLAAAGDHRAVGPRPPAPRLAGSRIRPPPGARALVRPLAEGRAERRGRGARRWSPSSATGRRASRTPRASPAAGARGARGRPPRRARPSSTSATPASWPTRRPPPRRRWSGTGRPGSACRARGGASAARRAAAAPTCARTTPRR